MPLDQTLPDHIKNLCYPSSWGKDFSSSILLLLFSVVLTAKRINGSGVVSNLLLAEFSNPIFMDSSLSAIINELPDHFELVYWCNTSIVCKKTGLVSKVAPLIVKKMLFLKSSNRKNVLHKKIMQRHQTSDALSLRYGWTPSNIPLECTCGKLFTVDHVLMCSKRGFPSLKHNEIKDLTADIVSKICHNVCMEPALKHLSGESLPTSSICMDGVRI